MRPVNLIPPEERPGERRPMRGGPLAYVIVGALAAAVIGVAVLAITGNQISESKAEIAQLKSETAAVEARAQALDAYTQFHSVSAQRTATITSLADSRFDWQRVMHELALVLPDDVWLTDLAGTANPSVSVDGAGGIALRTTIPGPALELSGCAPDQSSVARFIQALKEIDGVTRVGVQTSAMSDSGGSSGSGSATCESKSPVAQFQIVVAFDAAPVITEEEGEGVVPSGETATAAAASEPGAEE
jgi:Tfp pilus assembly protein PilN